MKGIIDGSNVLKPDFGWYEDPKQPEIEEVFPPKKRERVGGKQRGQKSEVYAFEPADLKKLIAYFNDNQKWIHYLFAILMVNTGRRCGDLIGGKEDDNGNIKLGIRWSHFFNPATGEFRDRMTSFEEEKTDKLASPHINKAIQGAIQLYCEKTGCDPSKDNYSAPVFMQLSGTHKGKVLSYTGAGNAIKQAATACGIRYNVDTHSYRKTFGYITRLLHPQDGQCIELLQAFYNHSSSAITKAYIGDYNRDLNVYVDDMGEFISDCIVGDKEIKIHSRQEMLALTYDDVVNLIQQAFYAGKNSDGSNDAALVIELTKKINEIKK